MRRCMCTSAVVAVVCLPLWWGRVASLAGRLLATADSPEVLSLAGAALGLTAASKK